ncbi:unnamed protein product [Effrenium voratum]|nr:unnamed protein product [Effrenium voratum]
MFARIYLPIAGSDARLQLHMGGIQLAYVTPAEEYENPLDTLTSPSGVFEYTATQPERMGRASLAAVFGPLESTSFKKPLSEWKPLRPDVHPEEKPAPFKIGGLDLPMVTYEGAYSDGVERLADLLVRHYGSDIYPVVSVGETGDALGYGDDLLGALASRDCPGFYFPHASGETCKSPEAYGKAELLEAIGAAKRARRTVLVIAVGGGVNGNATGMIAAMAGAAFIEVPTTLMHYNDATTSAKKAFSLVVNGQILSKNILGTFYLPQLVFCISETFLTLSKCSVHAAVGEACKTMGMLGIANSKAGQRDWHNILGAVEFASDFTKVIETVGGFEELIRFLQSTRELKAEALAFGEELSGMRMERASYGQMANVAKLREARLRKLRQVFRSQLSSEAREAVIQFLTVINTEIIAAKAMFLAYSDPFEKYRALLFEYAHTLGHGVEAFMNGLYRRATACGLDFSEAFRLHGQCVGMAVLWAGEMSKEQGLLDGDGFLAHQALLYTFNRFGGYDFAPLRRLCDQLDVSKEEFCEGVLQVVRRDNKRGYCKCREEQRRCPGTSSERPVRARLDELSKYISTLQDMDPQCKEDNYLAYPRHIVSWCPFGSVPKARRLFEQDLNARRKLWSPPGLKDHSAKWFDLACLAVGLQFVPELGLQDTLQFGPPGAITRLYVEDSSAHVWHAQIQGRRMFAMFAPQESEKLGGHRAEPAPGSEARCWTSLVELFGGRLESHAHMVVLEPGETLVVPAGWWQCSLALEPFTTLSRRFWNRSNRLGICDEISRRSDAREMGPSQKTRLDSQLPLLREQLQEDRLRAWGTVLEAQVVC